MMSLRTRSLLTTVAAAALLVPTAAQAAAPVSATPSTTPSSSVIATGLNGPRHLVVDSGIIGVAEAGTGGTLQCVPGTRPGQATQCLGLTGALTAIVNGTVTRVVTNLPSIANENGSFAVGPAGFSIANNKLTVVTSNLARAVDPVTGGNPFGANGTKVGRLLQWSSTAVTTPTVLADFGVYEVQNNPDGGAGAPVGEDKESNPYGVTAYKNGYAVVDAAANDVLFVGPDKKVTTLAVLPTKVVNGAVQQGVPTSVKVGPDGALYVSELSPGVGNARVYRIVPGQAPTVYADGFTLLTDLAFDAQGRLLVTSMNTAGAFFPPGPGAVVRVEKNGTRTTFSTGIVAPTGITTSGSNIYVSNQGLTPGAGQIVQINLP